MKKLMLVAMTVVFAIGMSNAAIEQVDVLGAHQNAGRGCAGCHTPHSGAAGSGQLSTDLTSGNVALWGQDVKVLYGKTFNFGDAPTYPGSGFPETLPGSMAGGIGDAETGGLLMCLSCHDGSVTPQNMMANQSYEQKIGILPPAYGVTKIPTLLGADGTTATLNGANYNNDHPVGIKAIISEGDGLSMNQTSKQLEVLAGSNYAQFVANYGWPSLAPGHWGNPYGVTGATGAFKAFVVCTTCHDQHLMNVYTSTTGNDLQSDGVTKYGAPIAGDGGGTHYATYFFVRGPYNVKANTAAVGGNQASSTTQFCRQCHFGESNEANGLTAITTMF